MNKINLFLLIITFFILSISTSAINHQIVLYPDEAEEIYKDHADKISGLINQLSPGLKKCFKYVSILTSQEMAEMVGSPDAAGLVTDKINSRVIYVNGYYTLTYSSEQLLSLLSHEAAHLCKIQSDNNFEAFTDEDINLWNDLIKQQNQIQKQAFQNFVNYLHNNKLTFEEYLDLSWKKKKSIMNDYSKDNELAKEYTEQMDNLQIQIESISKRYYIKFTNKWKKCFMSATEKTIRKPGSLEIIWNLTHSDLSDSSFNKEYGPAFGSTRPYSQIIKCGCEDTSTFVDSFYDDTAGFSRLKELLSSKDQCTVYRDYPDDLTLIEENCCAIAKAKLQILADESWIDINSTKYMELLEIIKACKPLTIPCGGDIIKINSTKEPRTRFSIINNSVLRREEFKSY